MTHHNLALKCTNGFKCNTDNDEDRCTAEADACQTSAQREDYGENCDDSEEYRTYKSYLVERIVDEIGSGLTGTITGDSTIVLLQVVCDLNRIIGN